MLRDISGSFRAFYGVEWFSGLSHRDFIFWNTVVGFLLLSLLNIETPMSKRFMTASVS